MTDDAPSPTSDPSRSSRTIGPTQASVDRFPSTEGPGMDSWNLPTFGALPARTVGLPEHTPPSIPGFTILDELGRGGMGIVYRARQDHLNRLVALKMIRDGALAAPQDRMRFLAEAEVVASIQHPGIVGVHAFGIHDGLPFFALEFCAGGSLASRLDGTPLPVAVAASLLELIARGVQAAHDHGIVHRDLKPGNILLQKRPTPDSASKAEPSAEDSSGESAASPYCLLYSSAVCSVVDHLPKIADFGLARRIAGSSGITLTGAAVGTPAYMAPEQAQGRKDIGPATDVWALGAILYECLTGRPPFKAANPFETLAQVVDAEPIPPRHLRPTLPIDLETICLKCLQKEPSRRYLSAAALADDLRRYLEGRPIDARPIGHVERLVKWTRRSPWQAAALLVGLAFVLTLGVAIYGRALAMHQRGLLAAAQDRDEQRTRLEQLQHHHADAIFFGTLWTGLDLDDGQTRIRQAASRGLALFDVTVDEDGPPVLPVGTFNEEEVRLVTDCCYELLLVQSDALFRQGRAHEALRLVTRADRLLGGVVTRCGLERRAACLEMLGQVEEARKVRRQAGALVPERAADHFLLALEPYRLGQFERAAQALVETLRRHSGHLGAEYVLAACRLQQGRHQEARIGLTRCLEHRPGFTWPRLLRGHAEMSLGNFAAARADFDTIRLDPPDDTAGYVALVNLGVLAMHQRHWEEADSWFRQAIARQPRLVPAYVNLALTHRQRVRRDRWQEALLTLAPGGGLAYLVAQVQHHDALTQATTALDVAIRHQPRVGRLYRERGLLHRKQGNLARAAEDLARATRLDPGQGPGSTLAGDLVELGGLCHDLGQHDRAIAACREALALRRDLVMGQWHLSRSLLALGRDREAGLTLDRFLMAAPAARDQIEGDLGGLMCLACKLRGLLYARENVRAAIDCYSQGLRWQRDAELLGFRGHAYLRTNALNLALLDFEEALRLDPARCEALLGRAEVRVRLADTKAALADVEAGLRRGPRRPRLLYLAARVRVQVAEAIREASKEREKDARSHDAAAVGLLLEAHGLVPAREKTVFWKEYVLGDPALAPIRQHPGLQKPDDPR